MQITYVQNERRMPFVFFILACSREGSYSWDKCLRGDKVLHSMSQREKQIKGNHPFCYFQTYPDTHCASLYWASTLRKIAQKPGISFTVEECIQFTQMKLSQVSMQQLDSCVIYLERLPIRPGSDSLIQILYAWGKIPSCWHFLLSVCL